MKKIILMFFFCLCLLVTGCNMNTGGKDDEHIHEFVEGKCECGEEDPEYLGEMFEVKFVYDNNQTEIIKTNGPITLPNPTKEGNIFLGWYIGSTLFEDTTVTSDITLTAKWLAYGTKFNVYYDVDGGTMPEDWTRYYNFGTSAILPIPEKKYNEFIGWYLDEEFTDGPYTEISSEEYGNKLYYAKWLDKAPYKEISYELNGGTIDNPLEKYITGEVYNLTFPKREGYYFKGWYLEEDFSGSPLSTITENFDSDIKLYAKWVERTLENATIAIYGDSISTFAGFNPDGFAWYYPQATLDVQTVGDTWWYKLYQNNNLNITINNSISGSGVINPGPLAGYNGYSQKRVDLLIQDNVPVNVVIIYLGINDCKVGTDVTSFKRAYKQMVNMMYNTLGDVDILVCTLNAATFSYVNCYDLRIQYNNALRELQEELGFAVVELDKVITEENKEQYMANMLHPNKKGMDAIYNEVMNTLGNLIGE